MIISWLLNTISEQISNSLTFVHSAFDLWSQLQEQYSQLDGHRIYQLMNDIAQLKQNNCSIEIYFHKLKGLWDECDTLESSYLCTCTCTCDNGKANSERDHRKKLIQFLMGLDECYTNIRGQILLMSPLPTVAKAYTMLRQEEKQREGYIPKSTIPSALAAQSSGYKSQNNTRYVRTNPGEVSERRSTFKKGVICGYCHKEGHTTQECYRNVGYPIGHPLHGKFKPPLKTIAQELKYNKAVNLAMGQDTSTSTGHETYGT